MLCAALSVAALEPPPRREVRFGDRTLAIPEPAGFEPVSRLEPELLPLHQSALPAEIRLIDTYVDRENFASVQDGTALALDRHFQLLVVHAVDGAVLSRDDSSRYLHGLEEGINEVQAGAAAAPTSKTTAGDTELDPVSAMRVYHREPWGLFHSAVAATTTFDANGTERPLRLVTSSAVVGVNHQVLNLLSRCIDDGSPSSMQWTRDALRRWATDLRAANPDDPALAASAEPSSRKSREAEALGRLMAGPTMIGLGIALLLALFFWKRR